ncbi:Putative SOS response-associated peptidase YedK [Chitinophaga terrae (ex Kim and Jung 2007)]|uniref:Abasic site processing protein n=1 Tax=Chitinophaga terrae (ex Kim and Jung 2007) TaxID=408074 RepID=A0A1H4F4C6_9BACT|nr:SOS response-associated peptidase family protein [Chitinophaga terrae (ex Kim and Jung 2007)]MDQ0106510.1 putative SOS response-associated peptidase YedK [Chitinophaga terrae (ex Kim and Jung 2007)]GEP92006.1 DUF159 family protein [Chitinophaga terrae (ex Kim and Jung 2007)]SEA92185.1 Putative SOS response-associated peptidase YedK [Chitinophaga terrae (ex Kim and Jung 2007)]
MCYAIAFAADWKSLLNTLPELNEAPGSGIGFEKVYKQIPDSFPQWPVIYHEGGVDKIALMEWSALPGYLEDPGDEPESRRLHAFIKAEELLDVKSYWSRISANRCLIPVTGFFEFHAPDRQQGEIPYYFRSKETDIIFMAGLYTYAPFADMETGELRGTFGIITVEANDIIRQINNTGELAGRMPLMFTPRLAEEWTDPDLIELDMYDLLTYSFRSDALEYWQVKELTGKQPDDETNLEKI